MAHAIMFDTLRYANRLISIGVTAEQAGVHAETLAEIFEEAEEHIATKSDLAKMYAENKADNLALRAEMNVKFAEVYKVIAETKNDIIKWVIGMAFGQTALIVTLLKILPAVTA